MENMQRMNSMESVLSNDSAIMANTGDEAIVEDTLQKGSVWGRFVTGLGERLASAKTYFGETISSIKNSVGNAFQAIGFVKSLFERKTEVVPAAQVQSLMTAHAQMTDHAALCDAGFQEKKQAVNDRQAEVARLRKQLSDAEAAEKEAADEVDAADLEKAFADTEAQSARRELNEGLEKVIEGLKVRQDELRLSAFENKTAAGKQEQRVQDCRFELDYAETRYKQNITSLESAQTRLAGIHSKLDAQEELAINLEMKLENNNAAKEKTSNADKAVDMEKTSMAIERLLEKTKQLIETLKQQRAEVTVDVDEAQNEVDSAEKDYLAINEILTEAEMELNRLQVAAESQREFAEHAGKRAEEHEAILKRYQPAVEEETQLLSDSGTPGYKTQVSESSVSSGYKSSGSVTENDEDEDMGFGLFD